MCLNSKSEQAKEFLNKNMYYFGYFSANSNHEYRGFLPNATFGSGKKIALAKLGKNGQKIALIK